MVVPDDKDYGYLESREGNPSAIDDIKETVDAAGKTVVAAALAGAVATGAAAVTPDQIHLPEPVPIVQMVDQAPDMPDQTQDDQAEKKESAWKNIFKILKYAVLALFFAAAFIFGILQGCAGCAGQVAAPILSSASESSQEAAANEASAADTDSSQASSTAASASAAA